MNIRISYTKSEQRIQIRIQLQNMNFKVHVSDLALYAAPHDTDMHLATVTYGPKYYRDVTTVAALQDAQLNNDVKVTIALFGGHSLVRARGECVKASKKSAMRRQW